MLHIFIVPGAGNPFNPQLGQIYRERLDTALQLCKPGDIIITSGRQQRGMTASEARLGAEYLWEKINRREGASGINLYPDPRPKSLAETINTIPQWDAWLRRKYAQWYPAHIHVVINPLYVPRAKTKIDRLAMPTTNGKLPVVATTISVTTCQGHPTVSQVRREKLALWKDHADPHDKWVNQWRISNQPVPVKALLLALDASLMTLLSGFRLLGKKSSPPKPLEWTEPDRPFRS